MRPFCHLMLKAIRVDSPPLDFDGGPVRKLLLESRRQSKLTPNAMAAKLGVSPKTIKNWEAGRSTPSREIRVAHPAWPEGARVVKWEAVKPLWLGQPSRGGRQLADPVDRPFVQFELSASSCRAWSRRSTISLRIERDRSAEASSLPGCRES